MYVVIDTWVWERAQELDLECCRFLFDLFQECQHILIDAEHGIEREYYNHLKNGSLLKKLFTNMVSKGKISIRSRHKIINDFDFDDADLKFLEVAISTSANVVSGEDHFLKLKEKLKVEPELRQRLREMVILTPSEACSILITVFRKLG